MSEAGNEQKRIVEIERKVNVVAACGLLISATTFIFTLSDQIRGSNIEIALPNQMATFSVGCFPKDVGFRYLKFSVPTRVSNTSAGNYPVDIAPPKVTVTLFGKEFAYEYQRTVNYSQLPGPSDARSYCKKSETGNDTGFDFYLNGLGISYLPSESFPILEKGKSWERSVLYAPVYIEECQKIGCERQNYINSDDIVSFISKNESGEKKDFSVKIKFTYSIKNRGLLWWIFNLFDTIIDCEQKFDFSMPDTQRVFSERGYVTRALSCKYI